MLAGFGCTHAAAIEPFLSTVPSGFTMDNTNVNENGTKSTATCPELQNWSSAASALGSKVASKVLAVVPLSVTWVIDVKLPNEAVVAVSTTPTLPALFTQIT